MQSGIDVSTESLGLTSTHIPAISSAGEEVLLVHGPTPADNDKAKLQ